MDLLLHSCLLSEAMTASIILDSEKNIRRATEQNNLARRLLKGGGGAEQGQAEKRNNFLHEPEVIATFLQWASL